MEHGAKGRKSRRVPITGRADPPRWSAAGQGPGIESMVDRPTKRMLFPRSTIAAPPAGTVRVTPCLPLRSLRLNRALRCGHRGWLTLDELASTLVLDVARIDRARILRGWTRRALGLQAHVDEGALCDLFAGRRRHTFGTLRAVCQAFELSLAQVVAFHEIERSNSEADH